MKEQYSKESKRKPVIGIMTGSFHTEYSKRIVNAICENLSDVDVEICLFQALDASRYLKIDGYVDKEFDLHYYSMFEYSKYMKLDLLIVSFGTISAIPEPLAFKDFLAYLPDIPVILLEDEIDPENGIHIMADNYQGMKECVNHLIQVHGCKRILFISGPMDVTDAVVRYQAYTDTMKEAGLPLEEGMIAWGDFSDHVDPLVREILSRYPDADAVVAANDEMAESTYRVLKELGKRPGREIAVTGFDDSSYAVYMDPPLATVRQNMQLTAKVIIQKIRDYFEGKELKSEYVPTQFVARESCGCDSSGDVPLEEYMNLGHAYAMRDHLRIKSLENDNMLSSLMFRSILAEYVQIDTFFQDLGKQFSRLGTAFSAIYLLKEPIRVRSGKKTFLPDEVYLYMKQVGENIVTFRPDQICKAGPGEIEYPEEIREQVRTAVFPLFYGNIHYGMLWVSLTVHQMLFYYSLSLEIGSGLRYLYMALDQQAAHAALEERSIVLDYSANHDEMTGCYNRVGIMGNFPAFMRGHDSEERFVAVMADLDHLKQINDTFGHAEGDSAIKKAADALQNAMPAAHLLGRTGGDEFMAVFCKKEEDAVETFVKRLREDCDTYNDVSGKPYYVNVSVGCMEFCCGERERIEEWLKCADDRLYEAKKSRRENVIRG